MLSRADEQERHLVDLAERGEVFFFVGSGISTRYPTCLPSALELLQLTASLVAPESHRDLRSIAERIQPEVFYQELSLFLGDKALAPLILLGADAIPALAHLLIARWSSMSGLPIVTTNFDGLLEKAARLLGNTPKVIVPPHDWIRTQHSLAIWKPHGSIDLGLDSVYSTMPQITQPNFELINEIALLARDKHLCLIGYSGRDIDLFPLISAQGGFKQTFWVDPSFAASTGNPWTEELQQRADRIGAVRISQPLDEIARRWLPNIVSLLPQTLSVSDPEEAKLIRDRSLQQRMEEFRASQAHIMMLSPAEQELFIARCFLRLGLPKRSRRVLARGECRASQDMQILAQAQLLEARLLDVLSDYDRSEKAALAALRTTSELMQNWPPSNKTLALRIQALHARAMARKMQLGPSIDQGSRELRFQPSRAASLAVLVLYIRYLVLMRWFLLLQRPTRGRLSRFQLPTSSDDVWILQAWTSYFDHVVVFLGFLRKLIRPESLQKRALRLAFEWLSRAASRAGDSFALANAEKELQRAGSEEIVKAFEIYKLTTDPLNASLLHRNEAEGLLRAGRRSEAAVAFRSCLRGARRAASYATMLKAVVGLESCGGGKGSRLGCYLKVFSARITGRGYRDYLMQLERYSVQRRTLTSPPR